MQFPSHLKTRLLHGLLHQLGMSEKSVKKFGMRSARSGAAGQALLNLTLQSGGVPQAHYYESIARLLGHTSLTRVTMGSYIGPLGNLLFDNSAVVFGEEEGAVGGKADLEARVARLPQYLPFGPRAVVSDVERAKSAERAKSVVAYLPKLPPSIAMVVDVEPAVVSASRAREDVGEELRRVARRQRLLSNAGAPESVPPIMSEGGREAGDSEVCINNLIAKMDQVTAYHTRVRRDAVRQVASNLASSGKALEKGILLRTSPDTLNKILNLLKKFHSERGTFGKYVAHHAYSSIPLCLLAKPCLMHA